MWETNIWNELDRMKRDMENIFNNMGSRSAFSSYPLVNAYQSSEEFTIVAEVPGMKKEDINISFQEGTLTFSGTRQPYLMKDDIALLRHEVSEGNFNKSLRIPGHVDEDMIKAKNEDGILTITIPRPEDARPKSIEIQA